MNAVITLYFAHRRVGVLPRNAWRFAMHSVPPSSRV